MNRSAPADSQCLTRLLAKYKKAKEEHLQGKPCRLVHSFQPLLPPDEPTSRASVKCDLEEAKHIVDARLNQKVIISLNKKLETKPRKQCNSHLLNVLRNINLLTLEEEEKSLPCEIFECRNDELTLKLIPVLLKGVLEQREEVVNGLIKDLLTEEALRLAWVFCVLKRERQSYSERD